jgi:PIN domain nuclease of toxin-antitoxin system
MTILLDSHVFYWWQTNDPRLSRHARELIEDEQDDVYVSAVVAWEIANKVRYGKWPEAKLLVDRFFELIVEDGFLPLPITLQHAHLAGSLAGRHRDPFDRMLAAQAQIENVSLVTADPVFQAFGTRVLW